MTAKPNPSRLTPYLEHLLALDQLPLGRPHPSPAEVEVIRGVLAEGSLAAKRVNLARAMSIAADSAPDEQTAWLIANILNDRNADAALRQQAASVLGDVPVTGASQALAEALVGSSAGLEATLLKSLAKIGGAEEARVISTQPDTRSPRLARLRDFARAAILYRIGGNTDERAEHAILPVGTAVAVTHESPAQIEAAVCLFRGSDYGLRFNPELGYALECGGARHLVLLSSELKSGALLETLAATHRIAGIVAMQDGNEAAASYIARRLIVTRPEHAGIAVSVVGIDGTVQLFGSLRPERKGLAINLHTYGTARPLITVHGTVTDDAMVLDVHAFDAAESAQNGGEVDNVVE